jgi:hypothetical protein
MIVTTTAAATSLLEEVGSVGGVPSSGLASTISDLIAAALVVRIQRIYDRSG